MSRTLVLGGGGPLGSAVEVIEPSSEVSELSGWGRYLMDFSRTAAAYEAGLRQGTAEASRLGPFWSP
ncbi:MAG: hypothetical protein ACHQIG_06865 [Acidimicrobiia bacterium]